VPNFNDADHAADLFGLRAFGTAVSAWHTRCC